MIVGARRVRGIIGLTLGAPLLAIGSIASGQPAPEPAAPALVDLANPLMGTDSSFELSYGNTYPAVAVPWGMNFWTPVTGKMGNGWGYT